MVGQLEVWWRRPDFDLPVDLLAVGAHPDDVEMAVGGILALEVRRGKRVAILDLTAGERGTRGSAEQRRQEAIASAQTLGVGIRVNLGLPDGFLATIHSEEVLRAIVGVIRWLQPRVMLLPPMEERHPDHGACARLVRTAIFLSGLKNIQVRQQGLLLPPYKPRAFFHYIQFYPETPMLLVDVSEVWHIKLEALRCYRSQFDPSFPGPSTILSASDFLTEKFPARFRQWGALIGVTYAEGLIAPQPTGIVSVMDCFFQT